MLNVMNDTGRRSRRSLARMAGFALVVASASPVTPLAGQADARAEVSAVLDALHEAASEADFDRYFSLYAGEAVFLGTDATERWTREEFMDYTRVRFDTGTGWTYHMLERHVAIAPGGRTAWFDERLENANLGETRGSGVLVMEHGSWKIAQYNLTIPIPNEMAREVAQRIRALTGGG
ncbi:MAG: nuclear transport factor 2 family protein [Gemmatimonadales bacterium]|nr:nuclear transport factor 2 family protein [Gemmatimonadales bacterium]MYK00623.1 nuclear transport factor 2 family protein [Candidatus Palauibacter ramosifaciens]